MMGRVRRADGCAEVALVMLGNDDGNIPPFSSALDSLVAVLVEVG